MSRDFVIFTVDDSEPQRILMESVFGPGFKVESFESAKACLQRLDTKCPDLFLLDVEMPGIDGYQLCRCLKDDPRTATTPAIFISSHSDIQSRLRGYDSGGEDFIAKPIDAAELRQKVSVVRRIKEEQAELAERLTESGLLRSWFMLNLDEYGVMITFLHRVSTCESYREVAEALIGLIGSYRLEGAVQLRLSSENLTLSRNGENRALEAAVLNDLRKCDRIFISGKRLAVNFDRVSIMINNMQTRDATFFARMCDHLAIAAESADLKVAAMLAVQAHGRTRQDISRALEAIVAAVAEFRAHCESASHVGTALGEEMINDLSEAFGALSLPVEHQNEILDIVRSKTQRLKELYNHGDRTEAILNRLSECFTLAQTQPPDTA